ncbi:MAG: penicillin-binding protein 2 [Bacteroidaceae bacterium]|nr:penicillin-binding protein 2 [Bacteroidaceae bacterium]
MKDYNLESRKYILAGVVILVLIIYIARLFSIQLGNEDYKTLAESNAYYTKTVYPARGHMYDRNGKLLVYNQPSYDITFIPREIKGVDIDELCQALGITREEYDERMKRVKDKRLNPGYSTYTEQDLITQLSGEDFARFQENMFRFPGFYLRKRSIRQYNYKSAGVLLGDIGEVSRSKIEKDPYYGRGDYIGTQGLEASYEEHLRGKKGTEVLLRDAHGRIQGSHSNGEYDQPAIRGKDLTLSLDIELQELGEKLMKNKIGSIVAIEPSTGEILCMVSAPSYDPSLLTGRQRGKNHKELSRDKRKPLLNRAIMGTYPPGSTFKTSQALTFLEEGILTPETPLTCSNGFVFNNFRLGCHAHASPTTLKPAIATSCNAYFCWGLHRMFGSNKYKGGKKEAMNTWRDYMVSMGFGYKLGVDLPGEVRGMIPNAEYYTRHYGNYWRAVTVISISIGQGEVTLTPLQIANLGATIANRGTYITPHMVKAIEGDTISAEFLTPKSTKAGKRAYEEVIKGMRMAVTDGTCRAADIPGLDVCGKTGTAQNKGKDHSAFMGFAPMKDPKIAIAVYVENGGFGATYGVPIGALLMEKYLNGELSEESKEKAEEISNKVIHYGTDER